MKDIKSAYKAFLNSVKGVNVYNQFKKILYGGRDSLVLQVFKLIKNDFKDHEEISILDVGGGDGKRLFFLMGLLEEQGIKSRAVLVEPSKAFVREAKQALRKNNYNVQIVHSTFEKSHVEGKFDLVLFIHSIFTFKDTSYLKKAKAHLAPAGQILILSNQENSLLANLKKIVDSTYKTKRKEIGSVIEDIKKSGIEPEVIQFTTKFNNVLSGDRLTNKGKLVLSWLALRPFSSLSQTKKQSILKVFKKHTLKGVTREKEIAVKIR